MSEKLVTIKVKESSLAALRSLSALSGLKQCHIFEKAITAYAIHISKRAWVEGEDFCFTKDDGKINRTKNVRGAKCSS